MPDPEPHSNNLQPDVAFRQMPARVPPNFRAALHTEMDLPRYGEAEDFHLRRLWRIIRKRRWLIIGIAVIVTTLVAIDAFRTKPFYDATATIEVGRDSPARVGSNEVIIQESQDQLAVTMNTISVTNPVGLQFAECTSAQLRCYTTGATREHRRS